MKKFLFLGLLFFIILILFVVFSVIGKNQEKSEMLVQNDGIVEFLNGDFQPKNLTIKSGQTVTWVNKSDEAVWPASNIHPTHQILPEFDPKRPIKSGDSWSFTFEKTGVWRYHNHLAPQKTAVVKVVE